MSIEGVKDFGNESTMTARTKTRSASDEKPLPESRKVERSYSMKVTSSSLRSSLKLRKRSTSIIKRWRERTGGSSDESGSSASTSQHSICEELRSTLLPIAALQDLNEDKKKKEREEMFNSLVKKNQSVPKEDEISNWVLAGQFSRMAYIKDYELREMFIKKTKEDKTFEVPCEECNQKVKRAAIDYKWREIYPAVCNVLEMDPISSCELGEKFDLTKDKDIRLGSQGDSTKTTIKLKSEKKNEITIPDHYTFYHYMYCKDYDTDVYILNLTEAPTDCDETEGKSKGERSSHNKMVIAWRGTELSAEDGFDKDDVLQDAKIQKVSLPWLERNSRAQVHKGFAQQYNSVREDLWEIVKLRLEQFGDTGEIVITGHSLGGALTILNALDFRLRQKNGEFSPDINILAYPLAAPRTGNAAFNELFTAELDDSFICDRLVLEMDWVPRMPPVFLDFKHVGRKIKLRTKNSLIEKINPVGIHHYSNYLEAIKHTVGSLKGHCLHLKG